MRTHRRRFSRVFIGLLGLLWAVLGFEEAAQAQASNAGPIQPWGLPPLPQGVGQVEKFADIHDTPQGRFLEGGAFDKDGNLWFLSASGAAGSPICNPTASS